MSVTSTCNSHTDTTNNEKNEKCQRPELWLRLQGQVTFFEVRIPFTTGNVPVLLVQSIPLPYHTARLRQNIAVVNSTLTHEVKLIANVQYLN